MRTNVLTSTPPLPTIADLPSYPATTPVTEASWFRLQHAIRGMQPPIAELSYFSNFIWLGADASLISRLGCFVLVQFADDARHRMLVATPGASYHGDPELHLLLERSPLEFLTAATCAAVAASATKAGVTMQPDRDHADYVYAASGLADLAGPELAGKRRDAARLVRRHEVHATAATLASRRTRRHVRAAYDRWLAEKYVDGGVPGDVTLEYQRFLELLEDRRARHLAVVELTVDGRPAGFSLLESMWADTWMGLVFKTTPALPGTTAYLRREVGAMLRGRCGIRTRLNVQQDVGLPGLRKAKLAYRPVTLIAKYATTPNAESARC